MAIRNIRQYGDPLLNKISRPVDKFDERLAVLLDDMFETMTKADGVGIAAPQVGILRRAVIVDIGEGLHEFINPEIVEQSEDIDYGQEGCLSSPGELGEVGRPKNITVKAYNRHGEEFTLSAEDFFARAICHEIDHLNGILFQDIAVAMYDPEDEAEEEPQQMSPADRKSKKG